LRRTASAVQADDRLQCAPNRLDRPHLPVRRAFLCVATPFSARARFRTALLILTSSRYPRAARFAGTQEISIEADVRDVRQRFGEALAIAVLGFSAAPLRCGQLPQALDGFTIQSSQQRTCHK